MGWNGGNWFVYFCKCLLSSYCMSGTYCRTPKLHRSLASRERVRVWARDKRYSRQKALRTDRPEEMDGE